MSHSHCEMILSGIIVPLRDRLRDMTLLLLDIGMGELVAIAVLAAVFMGPERVPALAKKAAKIVRFLRKIANTATDQIKAEIGPEFEELENLNPKNLVSNVFAADMQSELQALRDEMNGMRTEVTKLRLQSGASLVPPSKPTPFIPPPDLPAPQT